MKVNDLHSAIRGIDPGEIARSNRQNAEKPAASPHETVDGDSLDLTLSARITARSEDNAVAETQPVSELTPARMSEIQERIRSGFYNQPTILTDTAERVLNFYSR
jgi:hypothetical protein